MQGGRIEADNQRSAWRAMQWGVGGGVGWTAAWRRRLNRSSSLAITRLCATIAHQLYALHEHLVMAVAAAS